MKNIINFIIYIFNLVKKKIFISTLKKYTVEVKKKLQNLTPEEKIKLIAEIRFRIIYHVGTFLIAYQLISLIVDYLDQFF